MTHTKCRQLNLIRTRIYDKHSGSMKFLHTSMMLAIVNQHLIQLGPIDRRIENSSQTVTAMKSKALARQHQGGAVVLEKGIQTPITQGRSTRIISMIEWIRTSRLPIKKSLSGRCSSTPLQHLSQKATPPQEIPSKSLKRQPYNHLMVFHPHI